MCGGGFGFFQRMERYFFDDHVGGIVGVAVVGSRGGSGGSGGSGGRVRVNDGGTFD